MNPSPRHNFYRCMTLIVDNGNESAWELLDYYLSNQGTTLKDFIEYNQHEIYHLCYNYGCCCRCQYLTVNKPKSRILYQSQLDILLDTKGTYIPCNVHVRAKPTCSHRVNDNYANPNIVTKQLDLTLCRCLLFNFTNILPQGSVERQAFEDLISMLNKCFSVAKGEISNNDYQTYKTQIEKCILALAQIFGKTHAMQEKIKVAEKRSLDESIFKQLQQTSLQVKTLQNQVPTTMGGPNISPGMIPQIETPTQDQIFSAMDEMMGASGLLEQFESSGETIEDTTAEIQNLKKSAKRILPAVKMNTTLKIQKIDENTERKLKAMESRKQSVEHNSAKKIKQAIESNHKVFEESAAKIQKFNENTEKTMHAIDSSHEAVESTANNIEKLEERLSKCGVTNRQVANMRLKRCLVEKTTIEETVEKRMC
ncbi:unnamed protein product [Mytilus coruscus]|uniref:DZIP3-like HEPN domain-containing protein n=1 Tax=Mytilus coruscus TaxID=42192 RepID=A0A6J8E6J8_MYTCO|nr:unnamed protein product [Mytilus coruscus]